jgi:hypothetical protein
MRWRSVSGHCDSIRERRARESWEDGWEEETTETTTIVTTTIGSLAAQVFANPEEAAGFVENYLEKRKLDLDYLTWNGLTDRRFAGVC